MDRRGFLRSLIGGVATTLAVQAFPFRVYSFPTEIVVPDLILSDDFGDLATIYYDRQALRILAENLTFKAVIQPRPLPQWAQPDSKVQWQLSQRKTLTPRPNLGS